MKRKFYPTYFHQASLCARVTVWPGLKISSVSESWQLQLDLDGKIGSKSNVRACNLSPLRGCPSRQGYYLLSPWISKDVFSHGSNPLTPESNSPSLTLSKLVFLWVNCQVSASNLRDIPPLSNVQETKIYLEPSEYVQILRIGWPTSLAFLCARTCPIRQILQRELWNLISRNK